MGLGVGLSAGIELVLGGFDEWGSRTCQPSLAVLRHDNNACGSRRAGPGDVYGHAAGTVTTVAGEALCSLALLLRWPPHEVAAPPARTMGRPDPKQPA
jgi:hypothetical protein